jgi:hypothetical protein
VTTVSAMGHVTALVVYPFVEFAFCASATRQGEGDRPRYGCKSAFLVVSNCLIIIFFSNN